MHMRFLMQPYRVPRRGILFSRKRCDVNSWVQTRCIGRIYMRYWPSARSRWLDIGQVHFLRFFHKKRKKRTRPISSHLDPTSLEITENLYCHGKYFAKENFRAPGWTSAKFYCGNKTGNPEWAISAHLARSGRQSEHRIRFILPARGACHIIKTHIAQIQVSRSPQTGQNWSLEGHKT